MNEPISPTVDFRPLAEADFPILAQWLAEPHVRAFYQKSPATLEQVALEYGPAVRQEEPTICSLAVHRGVPFGYLQSYRSTIPNGPTSSAPSMESASTFLSAIPPIFAEALVEPRCAVIWTRSLFLSMPANGAPI